MPVQFSTDVRNAELDAVETTIGTAPVLEWRTGVKPADCATADSGTLVGTGTLPSDWLAAASGGSKAKAGTWTVTGTAGAGAGTAAGHFRIKAGAVCKVQGSITVTGGGGDMTADNVSIANAQVATVGTFTLTAGNA